jgi:hypothetical protein
MATVIATSIEVAQEAGERIETIYPLLTVNTISMALAFDRHTTKIMQVCGGVMHIHINEEQFMIDVDHINHETKFNRMEASSYLEPDTFACWVSGMSAGGRVRECTTFEDLVSSLDFVLNGRSHDHDPFSVSVNNTIPIELSEMKGRHDDFVPADDDPVMGSMKNSTQTSTNSGTTLAFHIKKGHCGYHPDCQVCTYLRLHFNRTFKEIGKYLDPRPCFEFNMDIMTVSHRSSCGNKYAVLMKCPAVGFNEVLFLNHKSDFLEEWIKLVDMRR